MRTFIILAGAALLAGCTHSVWVKPGAGPNELAEQRYACDQEGRYSPANISAVRLWRDCMEAHGWHVERQPR